MQLEPGMSSADMHPDPVETRRFQFSCEVGSDCTGQMIEKVINTIKENGDHGPNMLGNAQLVLAEVVNNIVEHGYGDAKGVKLQIALELTAGAITIETTDFGIPMPDERLPIAVLPESQVPYHALPEGGFGWYLIHTLAPGPVYTRRGNSNILRFEIRNSPI